MRQAIVQVAVARKGGGKTYTTGNLIEDYLKDTPTKTGNKVLIYDVNGEWTNKHIKEKLKCNFTAEPLALKDLLNWTHSGRVEVRRILPLDEKNRFTQDIDVMVEILNTILGTFRNGMLLLEDINAYLVDVSSKKVISAITRNRQKNLDIMLHYQSFRAIPPRIWANMNLLRFHKCNENIATVEAKLNNSELFFIAQALVNYKFKSDIRFFCYVNNEFDKISGKFSKRDFWTASLIYLKENKPDILRLALNRFGNSREGAEKAQEYCINELTGRYYGN